MAQSTRFQANQIKKWLELPDHDYDLEQLTRWLGGEDFSEAARYPHTQLLDHLKPTTTAPVPVGYAKTLASRLGHHIMKYDHKYKSDPNSDKVILNELRMAEALRSPEYLCDPLTEVYKLGNEFSGGAAERLPHMEALRDAIIANQSDVRFKEIWEALSRREKIWLPFIKTEGIDIGAKSLEWMPNLPYSGPKLEKGKPDYRPEG